MKCYEHTLVVKADLSESQSKKIVDKYQKIIDKNSGKILKTETWGLRTLSHKIKNNYKGYYFHIKFEGIGKTIEGLERAENIDEKEMAIPNPRPRTRAITYPSTVSKAVTPV